MSLKNSEEGWNGIQKEIFENLTLATAGGKASKYSIPYSPPETCGPSLTESELLFAGANEKEDPVNRPPHYRTGDIECIDYLCDNLSKEGFRGYLEGNAKKYMHRWRHKGGTEDLEKAQWYLTRLIKESNIGSN